MGAEGWGPGAGYEGRGSDNPNTHFNKLIHTYTKSSSYLFEGEIKTPDRYTEY